MPLGRGALGRSRRGLAPRALVVAVLVVAFAHATPASAFYPALTQFVPDPQVPGVLLLRSFTNSAGFKVEFRAWVESFGSWDYAPAPVEMCVRASRARPVGPHTREISVESGCSFPRDGFVWHQMDWTGSTSIEISTRKTVVTLKHHGGDAWTVVSRAERKSRTKVRLDWEPAGEIRPQAYAMPFICYALPPFGPVCVAWSIRSKRSMRFTGGFKFEGFNMATKLATDGHPGRAWLGT